jgi:hypothetical protein
MEKSLQLIRVTKEFLLLKKEEEDSMGIVSYLMNARIMESVGGSFEELCGRMPSNIQQLVKDSGSLQEAEKKASARAKDLQAKMAVLAPEIKKLSDQIEPYIARFAKPQTENGQQQMAPQTKEETAKDAGQKETSSATTTT